MIKRLVHTPADVERHPAPSYSPPPIAFGVEAVQRSKIWTKAPPGKHGVESTHEVHSSAGYEWTGLLVRAASTAKTCESIV